MKFLNYRNTCKEQWKIILDHFIFKVVFVVNGLLLLTTDNGFALVHYLQFTAVGFAII